MKENLMNITRLKKKETIQSRLSQSLKSHLKVCRTHKSWRLAQRRLTARFWRKGRKNGPKCKKWKRNLVNLLWN